MLIGVLSWYWRDTGLNHVFRIVTLVLLIVSAAMLFAIGFRCPHRRHSLVKHAPTILMTMAPFACPKCGATIDET